MCCELDRYYLVKGNNSRKLLIWTLFIRLDDHIWINLHLRSILVETCLLTFNKIFWAKFIYKKCDVWNPNQTMLIFFPYLKSKLVFLMSISEPYFSYYWPSLTQTFPKQGIDFQKNIFIMLIVKILIIYEIFVTQPLKENIIRISIL